MKTKEKLIPRLYRVTKEMDKWVKKQAKYCEGESDYIRTLIKIELYKSEPLTSKINENKL